ncbi:hypothetical protein CDIK_1851 [Cucumispora dikerogammari]|nr:hypothetical protein CDIK_1851 [Cucumispora dikerogammari]
MSIKQAAELYSVSYENAKKIIRNFKRGGVINKKKKDESEKSKLSHSMLKKIETIVSNNPAYTLKQIIDKIKLTDCEEFTISTTTVNRALRVLKITLKKIHLELDRVNSSEKNFGKK